RIGQVHAPARTARLDAHRGDEHFSPPWRLKVDPARTPHRGVADGMLSAYRTTMRRGLRRRGPRQFDACREPADVAVLLDAAGEASGDTQRSRDQRPHVNAR